MLSLNCQKFLIPSDKRFKMPYFIISVLSLHQFPCCVKKNKEQNILSTMLPLIMLPLIMLPLIMQENLNPIYSCVLLAPSLHMHPLALTKAKQNYKPNSAWDTPLTNSLLPTPFRCY